MEQKTRLAIPVLQRIRERGYWRAVIRPGSFERERIPFAALYPLLAQRVVRLRGWEFPQLEPYGEFDPGQDWIAHGSERYGMYLEYWRFYQSGQFVDFEAIAEDWRDQSVPGPVPADGASGRLLPIFETVYHLTEIFEFAARLALTDAYGADHQMRVEILLSGLQGRQLYVDEPERRLRLTSKPAAIDGFPYAVDLRRDEIVGESRKLALRAAEQIFYRFQWQPTPGVLERMQDELTQHSS